MSEGPDDFVYGTEESHGFLVGQYCRDKDGAVACMLMSELAAWVKSQGKSLFQYLDELYLQHGFHLEKTINIRMEGSDGMKRMAALLEKFRVEPPKSLGKIPVVSTCDYAVGKRIFADGATEGIDGPTGNVLVFETELPGNYVAARPSGTEPKVKFYTFTKSPVESISDLPKIRQQMEERINDYATDMQAFADQVSETWIQAGLKPSTSLLDFDQHFLTSTSRDEPFPTTRGPMQTKGGKWQRRY